MENTANNDYTAELDEETYLGGVPAWEQALIDVARLKQHYSQAEIDSFKHWLQDEITNSMKPYMLELKDEMADELWRREHDTGGDSDDDDVDIDQLEREYARCEYTVVRSQHIIEILETPSTRH